MASIVQLQLFGTVEISLTKGYVATVDSVDGDLALMKWQVHPKSGGRYYAKRSGKQHSTIHMHRVILERKLGRPLLLTEQVDHVDRDGLNNTRNNLRLSTPMQNQQNQRRHIDARTPYKNVTFYEPTNRWYARISVNGKRIHLGFFATPEEAYNAYCEAAVKYHGEYARVE